MREANQMETLAGPIVIQGWDEMVVNHRTRAFVFQCLVNFVLEHYIPPTKKELLGAVIKQQKLSGVQPLSNKSLKAIQDHLDNLVEDGYIYRLAFGQTADTRSETGRRKMGRGGPARCFWPVCVTLKLKEQKDNDNEHTTT